MRKTIKQLQGDSDYWRIKFINEQQRAEEKQQPMAYRWESPVNGKICYDGIKPLGVISQPLYLRPAPAVSLAELLEASANKTADEIIHLFDGIYDDRSRAWSLANTVWDACHAAILRNIEEATKK